MTLSLRQQITGELKRLVSFHHIYIISENELQDREYLRDRHGNLGIGLL